MMISPVGQWLTGFVVCVDDFVWWLITNKPRILRGLFVLGGLVVEYFSGVDEVHVA